jgi:hypothetical protein
LLVRGGILQYHDAAAKPTMAPQVRILQCRERIDGRGGITQPAGGLLRGSVVWAKVPGSTPKQYQS